MSGAALRDPAALPRATATLVAIVALWPLLVLAEFRPASLFAAQNLQVIGGFLATFLPLEHSPEFLGRIGRATLETLAMATAGVALAMLIAVPLAALVTRTLSLAGLGPAGGRWPGLLVRAVARTLLAALRGVPELVWALVFVRVFGLGAAAGVAALAITYGGMLGKVYAEILESADGRPARALLQAGSGRLAALVYGLIPNAVPELASYTVYRWECALRASVVMGFVGAGGLGQLMDQSTRMLNGGETATILVAFLCLVLIADSLSAAIRRALA